MFEKYSTKYFDTITRVVYRLLRAFDFIIETWFMYIERIFKFNIFSTKFWKNDSAFGLFLYIISCNILLYLLLGDINPVGP